MSFESPALMSRHDVSHLTCPLSHLYCIPDMSFESLSMSFESPLHLFPDMSFESLSMSFESHALISRHDVSHLIYPCSHLH